MFLESSSARAWAAVIGAGALWGVGALVADAVLARGVSPAMLTLARFALGLPLLWLAWRHDARDAPALRLNARERTHLGAVGAAMALNVVCWFAAIEAIGPAVPTVISICGAPVVVALVSVSLGWERLDAARRIALPLAIAGVATVSWPDGTGDADGRWAVGIALSIASALLYASVVIGNARMPSRIPPAGAAALSMAAATIVSVAIVALAPSTALLPSGDPALWAGLLYTGVVTTSVAYGAFVWGARRLSPIATVVGTLVEPVVAIALAAVLLAQPMSPAQWAGSAMLLAALVVLSRSRG